jgi:hypothetical protein
MASTQAITAWRSSAVGCAAEDERPVLMVFHHHGHRRVGPQIELRRHTLLAVATDAVLHRERSNGFRVLPFEVRLTALRRRQVRADREDDGKHKNTGQSFSHGRVVSGFSRTVII